MDAQGSGKTLAPHKNAPCGALYFHKILCLMIGSATVQCEQPEPQDY
jgi:hypothetical protein